MMLLHGREISKNKWEEYKTPVSPWMGSKGSWLQDDAPLEEQKSHICSVKR